MGPANQMLWSALPFCSSVADLSLSGIHQFTRRYKVKVPPTPHPCRASPRLQNLSSGWKLENILVSLSGDAFQPWWGSVLLLSP